MDKKEFKKALTSILKPYGFEYTNKGYYCSNDEVIVVIATQKSNFDDSFYLNYGFLIKKLNPELEYPKDNGCDVTGRFVFKASSNIINTFNLQENTIAELEESVNEVVKTRIIPVLEKGLQEYFRLFPEYVVTATLKTKEYLGIN